MNRKVSRTPEKNKIAKCYESWQYEDLQSGQHLSVLLHNPKLNRGIQSYPNFIIGVNAQGDTIAILDKDYAGKLGYGDQINVSPHKWTDVEKKVKKPLFTLRKKSEENDLYCMVKTVFYGKVEE